jgi:hypothetical protein
MDTDVLEGAVATMHASGMGNVVLSEEGGQRKSKTPNEGPPSSTHINPGSGQVRGYGPDGKPLKDIDYDHDHGQGTPHVHDWDRDSEGRPIRRPGRPFDPNKDGEQGL